MTQVSGYRSSKRPRSSAGRRDRRRGASCGAARRRRAAGPAAGGDRLHRRRPADHLLRVHLLGRADAFFTSQLDHRDPARGADHHHRARRGDAADLRRDRPFGRVHLPAHAVHHVLPDRRLPLPRPAGDTDRAARRRGDRMVQRLPHRHARPAVVHRHPGHRVRHQRASCSPGHTPSRRTSRHSPGYRSLDRPVRVGRDHLGGHPDRHLPDPAHPDPVGAAHRRHRRQPARRREAGVSVARIKYGNLCSAACSGRSSACRSRSRSASSTRRPADTRRCSTRWPPRSSAAPRCSAARAPHRRVPRRDHARRADHRLQP